MNMSVLPHLQRGPESPAIQTALGLELLYPVLGKGKEGGGVSAATLHAVNLK